MVQQNTYAIFESRKMFVAVPADKLHKKLTGKTEGVFEKAKEIFTETGVAYEDALEIPEGFEQKVVGLSGREKIPMFVSKKPKEDKKSSRAKAVKGTAKEKSKTANGKS